MINIELIVLVAANIANFLIGLFAFSKDWRKLTNRLFILLTFTLVGWTSFNYLSIYSEDPDLIFFSVKMILIFVVLQNTLFMLFVSAFSVNSLRLRKTFLGSYLAFSALTLLAGLTVGFFSGYSLSGDSISPEPGPAIALFMLHTGFSIGWGIFRLIRRYRKARGTVKEQYKFLILSGAVLLLIAPLTNFLLPEAK